MAAADFAFSEEEMAVDGNAGYPKAYAKLCRASWEAPYGRGPPFTFTPYILQPQEAVKASDLVERFPIMDPKMKPTTHPKIFQGLLWKQLNHLGNAGFDPAVFRVDPYGNVLYYHADLASPLAWDIHHWFPCSRGGLTVPGNLRILQWQVCKRKHNKLEFEVPWWDLQLGISINQFLSIFASLKSDFRHRAFSFLFSDGENEELNASQTVDMHTFPQHFLESKEKVGLAPAAVVVSQRGSYEYGTAPVRGLVDANRGLRPNSPIIAVKKLKPYASKENEDPDMVANPHQAIAMARDSLKRREENSKIHGEIHMLETEVQELQQKNEEERKTIQDLEMVLIKRRRRAEKCRRLAEAQGSYRTMLEKMIRDAMHQSVIYKEQARLNQAARNALMARLKAQRDICDAAEKELHKKFKQREDIEKQIRPQWWENTKKRSRIDDMAFEEEKEDKTVQYLPGNKLHKELRQFLEEEQKASEAGLPYIEEWKQEENKEIMKNYCTPLSEEPRNYDDKSIVPVDVTVPIKEKIQAAEMGEKISNFRFPYPRELETEEEDEETRKQRGKGNVEKWLQMLLRDTQEEGFGKLDPQMKTKQETDARKQNSERSCKEIIWVPKLLMLEDGSEEVQDNKKTKAEEKIYSKTMTEKHRQFAMEEKYYRKTMAKKHNDIKVGSCGEGARNSYSFGNGSEQAHYEHRQTATEEKNYGQTMTEEHNATEPSSGGKGIYSYSFEERGKRRNNRTEKKLVRSESAGTIRRIPSM